MTKIFRNFSFFKSCANCTYAYMEHSYALPCCLPQLVCRPCSKFHPARMRLTPQFILVGRLGRISLPLRRFGGTTHHQG